MSEKILIKRGIKSNLSTLDIGEFGFCTDTKELYIGSDIGNKLLNSLSNSTASYVLELDRWNVKNNGTDAVNTSNGINNALSWASSQGYVEVVLPKGTYLINKDIPIRPLSYMTLNLNGSTLQMESNSNISYNIIAIEGDTKFTRVTNGFIIGDRETHDYSSGETHEHGFGVLIRYQTNFITIDNLDIRNLTGDAVSVQAGTGYFSDSPSWGHLTGTFVQGGFDKESGSVTTDTTRIRSTAKIDVTRSEILNNGGFLLGGDDYAQLGSEINTTLFDIYFYKTDGTFIESKSSLFFDTITVPDGANYAYVSLRQSNIPSTSGCAITVRWTEFPKNIYIEKSNLHSCRRLGLSLAGQYVYLSKCKIHDNGTTINGIAGTGPNGGIDIEDGGQLNQHIFIENNLFYGHESWAIINVAGRYVRIKGNTIRDTSVVLEPDSTNTELENNIFINSGAVVEGEAVCTNNEFYNSALSLTKNEWSTPKIVMVNGGYFHNSSLSIDTNGDYLAKVQGCVFYGDSDGSSTLTLGVNPQTISDCLITGNASLDAAATMNNGWVIDNLTVENATSVRLGNGVYRRCKFINPGKIDTVNSSVANIELDGCHLEWNGYNLFEPNMIINLLRIKNSTFKGVDGSAFNISQIGNRFELISNKFELSNTINLDLIIINNGRCDYVVINNNEFIASVNMNILNIANTFVPGEFKNNIVINMTIPTYGEINTVYNTVNGTLGSSSAPTTGYYNVGQIIENPNPLSGGYIGLVCTTSGVTNTYNSWVANTTYWKGSRITMNGHNYYSTNEGLSGSVTPTFPSSSGGTIVDNTITWKEFGVPAVFKQYGLIQ